MTIEKFTFLIAKYLLKKREVLNRHTMMLYSNYNKDINKVEDVEKALLFYGKK